MNWDNINFYITFFFNRTGMVGYYKPTSDSISSMVIIVITIGVGAPAVFILIGILVTLVRKVRLSRKGYEQIN